MKVSIIVPIFNEEFCIADVVEELCRAINGIEYEILLVDDGSEDGTPHILRELMHNHPEVRLFTLNRNCGQSAAFWVGFQEAKGDFIALMDADGQNVPSDITKCLAAIEDEKADICCGYRARRNDTWTKKLGSIIANSVRRTILRDNVRDTGCSLKVFRADLLRHIEYWDGAHRFLPMLASRGREVKMTQIPVEHRGRLSGVSKYTNWGRLRRTIRDLFGVAWLQSRSKCFSYVEFNNKKCDSK